MLLLRQEKSRTMNTNIQEKDLIIFPAFLLHKTQINTIDEERIVVSINFKGKKYD